MTIAGTEYGPTDSYFLDTKGIDCVEGNIFFFQQ
jgi:hypothetical protein